jgi:hypothetical protein
LSVDSDKSDRSLKRESSSGSSKDKSKDKDKLKREVSSGSSKEREKDKEKLKREVSSGSSKDKSDREKVKREVSSGSKDKGRSTPSRELSLNDSRSTFMNGDGHLDTCQVDTSRYFSELIFFVNRRQTELEHSQQCC